jgi:hypothetical protein
VIKCLFSIDVNGVSWPACTKNLEKTLCISKKTHTGLDEKGLALRQPKISISISKEYSNQFWEMATCTCHHMTLKSYLKNTSSFLFAVLHSGFEFQIRTFFLTKNNKCFRPGKWCSHS